jgi:hypothetical protein
LNLSERRELNNGFGEALSRAFEITVTPAIFGVAGYFLDRKLGVVPLFTLVFSLFVLGYMFWKYWRLYEEEMTRHEQSLPGRRPVPDQKSGEQT